MTPLWRYYTFIAWRTASSGFTIPASSIAASSTPSVQILGSVIILPKNAPLLNISESSGLGKLKCCKRNSKKFWKVTTIKKPPNWIVLIIFNWRASCVGYIVFLPSVKICRLAMCQITICQQRKCQITKCWIGKFPQKMTKCRKKMLNLLGTCNVLIKNPKFLPIGMEEK